MTLQSYRLACARGERNLFSDINFEIKAGDVLRVNGSNGSGKTSLLRMLCGLALPSDGEVRWNGKNVRGAREEFCSELVYLGHANSVKDDLAAWENLMVAATISGYPISREQAWKALETLGLGEVGHLPTRSLSQGQRKRVALARLWLKTTTRLWILDEPFTALDRGAVEQLREVLNKHSANGGLLIFTTHQEIELGAGRMLQLDLGAEAVCCEP